MTGSLIGTRAPGPRSGSGGAARHVRWLFVVTLACAACLPWSPATAGETRTFELAVQDGRLVGATKVVRVRKGDAVEITWRSDRAVEIHLHGYDSLLQLEPGKPATMKIEAFATGRFPISLHGRNGHGHGALAYFEVLPE